MASLQSENLALIRERFCAIAPHQSGLRGGLSCVLRSLPWGIFSFAIGVTFRAFELRHTHKHLRSAAFRRSSELIPRTASRISVASPWQRRAWDRFVYCVVRLRLMLLEGIGRQRTRAAYLRETAILSGTEYWKTCLLEMLTLSTERFPHTPARASMNISEKGLLRPLCYYHAFAGLCCS